MPEKNKPIRGSNDTSTIARVGYKGNIPSAAFEALENEAAGVIHGMITLAVYFKDGCLIRYTTHRERSFVPGKPTTGSSQ
jgi:hypothetical protein